jgi:hypothetical protein
MTSMSGKRTYPGYLTMNYIKIPLPFIFIFYLLRGEHEISGLIDGCGFFGSDDDNPLSSDLSLQWNVTPYQRLFLPSAIHQEWNFREKQLAHGKFCLKGCLLKDLNNVRISIRPAYDVFLIKEHP